MKFLCAAAREKVTPELGTHLYGYSPYIQCDEIHDDLFVSAIAFGNGEKTYLLVSVDSGDVNTEIIEDLISACAEKCNLEKNNIIIAATHTHCAPNLSGFEGWGEIDTEYYNKIFRPAVISASEKAVSNMVEAEIGLAVGKSDVGINRRQYTENCDIILGQNPWGLYDSDMTLIKIRNKKNKDGIVNIVHYGCHGTACGGATIVTRDWYGMMLDRMEKETQTLSVFVNGAIGDVGPRLTNGSTTGDITHVEELGSRAASDAMRIIKEIKFYYTPEICSYHGEVNLPYQEFEELEKIQKQKQKFKEPEKLFNCYALEYRHLCDVEDILTGKVNAEKPDTFKFNINMFSIGSILFVPYPYEIFSEISIRMRQYSGYKNTLCLSCANGYNGYLPTQPELCRGGYEVAVFRYGSVYSLADNTDDNLVNETLKIIKGEK